ncbi:MAG: hypothetical protein EOO11_15870 [Chitinophagaceae bacterium]|nr:MAG: hypothetical protein EOO11_15870 [Chitinophagaceae bacterium]
MSNATNNRINTVLSTGQETAVNEALDAIDRTLGEVYRSLTPRERQTIPKISKANDLFVKDAIGAVQLAPESFPRNFNIQNIINDYKLYNQLQPITRRVRSLLEKLEDTMMLAGSESFIHGLLIYRMVGNAAESGEAGMQSIHRTLRTRFDRAGNELPEETEAPEPARTA